MKKLIRSLKKKKLSLALAESCTAGYASYLVTKTAGSSKVFKGGVIVYSLESKNKFFKIPLSTLKKTQGVSEKTALALARGVRKLLNADIGGSVVGFAGPTDKKTGLCFIAVCNSKKSISKKLSLKGSRDNIRKKAGLSLLSLITSFTLNKI